MAKLSVDPKTHCAVEGKTHRVKNPSVEELSTISNGCLFALCGLDEKIYEMIEAITVRFRQRECDDRPTVIIKVIMVIDGKRWERTALDRVIITELTVSPPSALVSNEVSREVKSTVECHAAHLQGRATQLTDLLAPKQDNKAA